MADYVGGFGKMLIDMANENQKAREKRIAFNLEAKKANDQKVHNEKMFGVEDKKANNQREHNKQMFNLQDGRIKNANSHDDRMFNLELEKLNKIKTGKVSKYKTLKDTDGTERIYEIYLDENNRPQKREIETVRESKHGNIDIGGDKKVTPKTKKSQTLTTKKVEVPRDNALNLLKTANLNNFPKSTLNKKPTHSEIQENLVKQMRFR
ncbi:MAG: hypothetical protein CSA86_01800 [Arcobacter sp.]|nr:MAG: hypothetical protein CSA86_01800 [Arcobacter sp.]